MLTLRYKSQRQPTIVSLDAPLSEADREQIEERLGSLDPYEALIRKITNLAELLDVSEREAERILRDHEA